MGESCVAESLDDLPGSVVADIAVDQGDGTTTESTTGHPRTEDPGSAGCVDGGVQLGASDLVVVTQGVVGGVHERSDLADASGVDELGELSDAVIFGDDVTDAAGHLLVVEG